MQREETVGITTDVYRGRGDSNLYRSISYRTAGGCCVQNREMEDGGMRECCKILNVLKYEIVE